MTDLDAQIAAVLTMQAQHDGRWMHSTDHERMASLIRQLAAERAADAWQPIETAPKDGTRIMLAIIDVGCDRPHSEFYHLATWDGEHCHPYIPNNWTHWKPLPSITSAGGTTDE